MDWLWLFVFYSFLGYLLERMYAKVTRAHQQVRKAFLLLPLCPVYGLGMTAFLALTEVSALRIPALILRGAVICTLVEYSVHFFYEKVFRVRFWDYSAMPGNVWGRVCPLFSLIWGVLSAFAALWLQPLLLPLARGMPPAASYGMLLVLTADVWFSAALLYRYRDTELLSLRAVSRKLSG